MQELNKGSS